MPEDRSVKALEAIARELKEHNRIMAQFNRNFVAWVQEQRENENGS